jgi:hypothetical protein
MNELNKLTVKHIKEADIVLVNFNVLNGEKYFHRLSRLSGMPTDSVPKGRHFVHLYEDSLRGLRGRVSQIRDDTANAYASIQQDAEIHERRSAVNGGVHLAGKKSAYKSDETTSKPKAKTNKSQTKDTSNDPWGLSKQAKRSYQKMTCPPLEMFYFRRVVVDEL